MHITARNTTFAMEDEAFIFILQVAKRNIEKMSPKGAYVDESLQLLHWFDLLSNDRPYPFRGDDWPPEAEARRRRIMARADG